MPEHHADPTFLMLSLATLVVGPLLVAGTSRRTHLRVAVEAIVIVAVAALVMLEILPECVHVAGGAAIAVGAFGLGVPLAIDGLVHRGSRGARGVVGWLGAAALAAHAVTDGLGLAGAGGHVHGHGDGLGLAIVLHHVPEGAAIWWLLRPRSTTVAIAGLAVVAGCTIGGFVAGASLLPFVDGEASALFQAFVAGVLLHVLAHHTVKSALPWALGGWLIVIVAQPFLDDGGHSHEHHGAYTIVGLLALLALLVGSRFLHGLLHVAPDSRHGLPHPSRTIQ